MNASMTPSTSPLSPAQSKLPEVLRRFETQILAAWNKAQTESIGRRGDLIKTDELHRESAEFLSLIQRAAQKSVSGTGPEWEQVRDWLATLSRSRTLKGFSPSETASFIFSLKPTLFLYLRDEYQAAQDLGPLADEYAQITAILDRLGLYTTEIHQKTQQEVIIRQQENMLELSTPVVKLWEGILALPLIGTLDSARTQIVMESLLQRIVDTGAEVAIIDITGVPTVDTLVAQHLLKTITAARLMGADCIISGIRPQIAATIVHLGVDLGNIVTKASLADAFKLALRRIDLTIAKAPAATMRPAPAKTL